MLPAWHDEDDDDYSWKFTIVTRGCFWFGLVWCHIVGYLIPNPAFTYILDTWFVDISQQSSIVPNTTMYH